MAEVPARVKIVSGLFALSGMWTVMLGAIGYFYGIPVILAQLTYVLIGLGLFELGIAYGLYRGMKLAWFAGMVLVTVSALLSVYQYFMYGSMDYLTLVIDAMMAVALLTTADYYKVQIPLFSKPKASAATVMPAGSMKFFRRL